MELARGIYLILCRNKVYVGQSIDIGHRWLVHLSLLRKGKNNCTFLQRMWDSNTPEDFHFVIAEETPEGEDMTKIEQSWIDLFESRQLMNVTSASRSHAGVKRTETTKRRLRVSLQKRMNEPDMIQSLKEGWAKRKERGWALSAESKLKMSRAKLGKGHSHGGKISLALKGKSHHHGHKISMTVKGRKKSEEHKQKLSEALKGRALPTETRRKMCEAQKIRRMNESSRTS